MALVDGTPWQALGYGLLSLGALAWLARRRASLAGLLLLLGLGAGLQAARLGAQLAPRTGEPPGTGALIQGRWQNLGKGSRGYVVPDPGQPATRLILVPAAGRIPSGARVSARPSEPALPWAAGPSPGPMAREGRFLGLLHLQPDELIVHAGVGPGGPGGADSLVQRMRRQFKDKADQLEATGLARGLVRALLLGDRSQVSPACLDLFTRTGARHGLALSGLHVGLVSGLLLVPLSALLRLLPSGLFGSSRWRARRRRELLILCTRLGLLLGFVLLVDAGAPVLRAACALSLALLAPHLPGLLPRGAQLGRRPDGLSLWAAALVLELLCNPLATQQLSLRLSYMATLGLLLCTHPLMRLFGLRRGLFDTRFHQAGPGLATWILLERLIKVLGCTLCASMAAVLATLPDIATSFGEVSPTGLLFAPLVLPLLALLLVSAWVSVLLGLDLWVAELAQLLVGLLAWIDLLPGTPMPLPPRPALLLWSLCALVMLALNPGAAWLARLRGSAWPRRACQGLAGTLLLPWQASASALELHLLDVGHGTCAVLRAPGLPALVFDSGSLRRTRIYQEALAPLLASWEVERPWVVLSHNDRDHNSGLPRLIERYPPGRWFGALPKHLGERLAHTSPPTDLLSGRFRVGWRAPGSPLELDLLRGLPQAGNEGSRSLLITWRGQELLLSGDAEAEGLGALLDESGPRGPLKLLLFPHHGSETALLSAMLARWRPERVWISGAQAEPPVAPELDRRGLPWRSTGAQGALALRLR